MYQNYSAYPAMSTGEFIHNLSTRGASQLVCFGMELVWVNSGLTRDIRNLERALAETDQELAPFKKENQIEVSDGPIKSVSVEVFSCDQQRVVLLLQVFGKTQQLEFK